MTALIFTTGRYQPPHAGHLRIVSAMRDLARPGDVLRIYATRTQGGDRNPLPSPEKAAALRALCPDVEIIDCANVFAALEAQPHDGPVTIVLGADRAELGERLQRFIPGLMLHLVARPEGALSGTRLRELAVDGDEAAFTAHYPAAARMAALSLYTRLRAQGA